jgi:signal transduction histidine kinase
MLFNRMKFIFKILKYFCIFSLFLFIIHSSIQSHEISNETIIDNFSIYPLTNWKYSKVDQDNNSLPNFDDSNWEMIQIPNTNKKALKEKSKIVWYRHKFLNHYNSSLENIGIILPPILDPYIIYLNGKKVYSTENSPLSGDKIQTGVKINYIQIPKDTIYKNDWNLISIKVLDNEFDGRFLKGIYIGGYERIKNHFLKQTIWISAVGLFFILFGVYSIIYALNFKIDIFKVYLVLGFLSIVSGVFVLVQESIWSWFIDNDTLYYILYNLSFSYFLPFYHLMAIYYFERKFSLIDNIFMHFGIIIILGAFILFLPSIQFIDKTILIDAIFYWSLIYSSYIILMLLLYFNKKRTDAILIVGALLLFGVAIRAVYFHSIGRVEGLYVNESYLIYIFVINFMLSRRESLVHKRLLDIENSFRNNLEIEVKNKTRELENINKDLVNSNLLRDKLFSIISHDLRSPLYLLNQLLALIKSKSLSQEQFKKYIKSLNLTLEQNSFLLENLLKWSSSQLIEVQVNNTNFEINYVIQEIVTIHKNQFKSKQIKVIFSEYKTYNVSGDLNLIRIVLHNILNNSIKYSHKKGIVEIKIIEKNNKIFIYIEDNGVGIFPYKKLDELLNGTQHKIGTEGEKGIGIGLRLCRDFLKKMGQDLYAENKESGGAVFYFSIDKSKED